MKSKISYACRRLVVMISIVSLVLTSVASNILGNLRLGAATSYFADDSWKDTGMGTVAEPYLVGTADQLYSIASDKDGRLSAGKYFRLTNDIYLNDTSAADWYNNINKQWVSNFGMWDTGFSGTLDGNGYTIYGLYYSKTYGNADAEKDTGNSDSFFAGLFPKMSEGAEVKNLVVRKSNIDISGLTLTGDVYAGTIAAYSYENIAFTKCYIGEDVTVKGKYVGGILGGFGGGGKNAVFTSTAFTGSIATTIADIRYGGFVGFVWAGNITVNDSFTTAERVGNVTWSNSTGFGDGIYAVGEGDYGFGNGCVTIISAEKMKGEAAKTNMPKLNWNGVWETRENGYPELHIERQVSFPVWNGTADDSWKDSGMGTSAEPYIINTAEQLYSVASDKTGRFSAGKYFRLDNDIYLNNTEGVEWLNNSDNRQWVSNFGMWDTGFSGTLDGNGYTIYGLYYSKTYGNADAEKDTGNSDSFFAGLFPKMSEGAEVKNLVVRKSNIDISGLTLTGDVYAGTIAAYSYENIAFTKCYIGEDVTVKGKYVGGILGGFGGGGKNAVFTSTAFTGSIATTIADIRYGGFVGFVWAGNITVNDSFTTAERVGNVTWSNSTGFGDGIYAVGEGDYGFGNGCVTIISAEKMKGEAAKTNMPKLAWDTVWVTTDSGYPELYFESHDDSGVWNGTADSSWLNSGNGTAGQPYLISTAEQLYSLASDKGGTLSSGKYFKLTSDIYLNRTELKDWTDRKNNRQWVSNFVGSDAGFSGIFDGDGHSIYGLFYSKSLSNDEANKATNNSNSFFAGLFPKVSEGAEVKNLIIRKSDIDLSGLALSDGMYAGAISAYADSNISFTKCYIGEDVSIKSGYAGGILGGYGGSGKTATFNSIGLAGSIATTIADIRYGGVVGNVWAGTVSVNDTFNAADRVAFVTWSGSSGSGENIYSVGEGDYGLANGCVTVISAEKMKGEAAKTNMPKLAWDTVWVTTDSGYPELYFEKKSDNTIWSGEADNSWSKNGSGTQEDPYLIYTAEQLFSVAGADLASTSGKYFKLQNDIYLNDVTDEKWYKNKGNKQWITTFDMNVQAKFSGIFDGNGYTVYGLYYDLKSVSGGSIVCGLFPKIFYGAEIRRLNVDKAYIYADPGITQEVYASAIIGFTADSEIKVEKCYVGKDVHINTVFAGGFLGGMGAWSASNTVTIDSCAFVGSIAGTRYGGFAGNIWAGSVYVKNSFTSAKRGGFITWGGSSGYSESSYVAGKGGDEIQNTFKLTEDQMKGEAARRNMPQLSWGDIWVTTEDSYPVFFAPDIWSGNADDSWQETGSGTENSPYIISSAEQLYSVAKASPEATAGKHFKLAKDIYLNKVEDTKWAAGKGNRQWITNVSAGDTAGFAGIFDGDWHTVYGLYYNVKKLSGDAGIAAGLFPKASANAVIKNLNLSDSHIYIDKNVSGDGYASALIGYISSPGVTIEKCYVTNDVSVEARFAGGLIGGMGAWSGDTAKIISSAYLGTVSGERSGGYAGNVWAGNLEVSDSFTAAGRGAFITWSGSSGSAENSYCTNNSDYDLSGIKVTAIKNMAGKTVMYKGLKLLGFGKSWKTTDTYPRLITDNDVLGEVGKVWSGKMATWIAGAGTKAYPYIIDTPERLYKMVSSSENGAYYSITEDMLLNDTSAENWYSKQGLNEWVDNYTSNKFSANVDSGKADGTLAEIKGIYKKNTELHTALIPHLGSNATVRNIRISNSYISGKYNNHVGEYEGATIGAITAAVEDRNNIIEGCIVEESVILDTGWRVGGIATNVAGNVRIDNCAFKGVIKGGSEYSGGIVADSWGSAVVTHCYSINQYVVNKFDVDNSRLELSYSNMDQYSSVHGPYDAENAIKLRKNEMKGTNALNKMKFLSSDVWTAVDGDYPDILKKIELYDGIEGAAWSGKRANNYAGGSGSENDPYIIKTAEQLCKMLIETANADYYRLDADIIINDTTGKEWYAKEGMRNWVVNAGDGFRGHLDGNYHTVSGLYYNSDGLGQKIAVAVIPYALGGASIKKLGVTKAYISMENVYENYGASVVGVVRNNGLAVTVDRCFGDNSVLINTLCSGGIVGRANSDSPASISNCFFTGSINGDDAYSGAMIGRLMGTGSVIRNTFASTAENGRFVGGEYGRSRVDNNDQLIDKSYYYGSFGTPGVDQLNYPERVGKQVEKRMNKLDFSKIWLSVEKGTPVLRGFVTPERFSDTGSRTTTIMFVTNASDISIDPITAEIESKLTLPRPERLGYKFGGWFVYEEFAIEFNETTMPLCDMTLYAKWIPTSIIQDFENYPNTEYDITSDYQYYRPGASEYSAKYTHGGYKAMHRLGKENTEQDFLVNYEEPLKVGKKYKMYIWVCTDADNANFTLSLVHNTWPDIAEPIKAVEKMFNISSIANGEWTRYEYTFTAATEYISIRSTGGVSIYFDDIMLIEEGDGNIKDLNNNSGINNGSSGAPKTGERIAITVLAGITLFASLGVLIITRRKIGENKK